MHAVLYVSLYRSPAGLTCSPPGKPWFVTVISIVLFPADRYEVTSQESWVPSWKLFAFASRQVVATLFISTEYVLSVAPWTASFWRGFPHRRGRRSTST